MKKRAVYGVLVGALLASMAAVSGCQTGAVQSAGTAAAQSLTQFSGGGVSFACNTDVWRVSSADRFSDGVTVSVFNQDNDALVSMIAYKRMEANETELFNSIRESDSEYGIKDEKTERETVAGLKRRSLSYWVADEEAPEGKRYVYAEVFRFQDSQAIAILSNYYHEEDRQEIRDLLGTLKPSAVGNTEDYLGTLEKDQYLGTILDDFVYFHNGEYESHWETVLADLDSSFHEKSGYDYIFDTQIAGYSGNIHTIAVPEISDYDGSYYYYYEHGLYLYLSVDSLNRSGQTVSDFINTHVKSDVGTYKDNPRDYTNLVEEPLVVKGDYAYQVVRVDYVSENSETTSQAKLYYARKMENDEILVWTLELMDYYFDSQTYPILQELLEAYEIPAEAYPMEMPKLTIGGSLVVKGQELYDPYESEHTVAKADGAPLLGKGLLEYEGHTCEVYVPRGRNTSHYDYYISFDMYGLSGEAEIWNNYNDYTALEYAADQIDYTYSYHKEYSHYYQDISELKENGDLPGGMAAAYFSEYYINTDNSKSLVYHIVLSRDLGDSYMMTLELDLDTAMASAETLELLEQYGKALGIDLYGLLDSEDENPLLQLNPEI